jgi:hypothetical protein
MLSIADRLKGLLISKKNAENNSISSFPSIMKTVFIGSSIFLIEEGTFSMSPSMTGCSLNY